MSYCAQQIKTPENAMIRSDYPFATDCKKITYISCVNCRILLISLVISRLRRRIVPGRLILELKTKIFEFVGSHEIPIKRRHSKSASCEIELSKVPKCRQETPLTYPCDNLNSPWQASGNPRYSHLLAI